MDTQTAARRIAHQLTADHTAGTIPTSPDDFDHLVATYVLDAYPCQGDPFAWFDEADEVHDLAVTLYRALVAA